MGYMTHVYDLKDMYVCRAPHVSISYSLAIQCIFIQQRSMIHLYRLDNDAECARKVTADVRVLRDVRLNMQNAAGYTLNPQLWT